MIPFDLIRPHLCLTLDYEDIPFLEKADAGDAEAQNEVALMLISNDKHKSAIYWLELAAKQNFADSMSLLSQCYMNGNGVQQDKNIGMMWLAKAASFGHVIAQAQMQAFERR